MAIRTGRDWRTPCEATDPDAFCLFTRAIGRSEGSSGRACRAARDERAERCVDEVAGRDLRSESPQVAFEGVAISAQSRSDTIPAVADTANRPPRYPDQLRLANIEGRVIARFVVRADGQIDPTTFVVVSSSHDLFTNSVREGAKTFHFFPATIKGKPVDWLVTMPFLFSLSK